MGYCEESRMWFGPIDHTSPEGMIICPPSLFLEASFSQLCAGLCVENGAREAQKGGALCVFIL